MNTAYYEKGWLLGDDGALQGLSLGFDHCGQHEYGVKRLSAALGVSLPAEPTSVDDHKISRVPACLRFFEYQARSSDKRMKPYPAALLICDTDALEPPKDPAELARVARAGFFPDHPKKGLYDAKGDVATSWCHSGFAVHVRGEENIARLRELHAAFEKQDIAMAMPWAHSFLRGGLSFTVLSAMPTEAKADVAARYADANELSRAATATGIRERLAAAGVRTHALAPGWMDDTKTEVAFFINPASPRARASWYSVEELDAWIAGKGPVIEHAELKRFEEQPAAYNWPSRLIRGLQSRGISLRFRPLTVWKDEESRVPGIQLRVHRDSQHLLASGIYGFEDLLAQFGEPLEQPTPWVPMEA